jgi:hypothetical protein
MSAPITVFYDHLTNVSKTSEKIVFSNNVNILPTKPITKIELLSIEMMQTIPNIRRENGSNILQLTLNNILYTFTIAPLQYFSLNQLLDELNRKIGLIIYPLGGTCVFSVNPMTASQNILAITLTGNMTSLVVQPSILSNILGFQTYTRFVNLYVADSIYNLNHDTYFSIRIHEISNGLSFNNSQVKSVFKLPCFCNYGQLLYFTDSFLQNAVFNASTFQINSTISISLVDRYNFPIMMDKLDIAFSIRYS